MAATQKTARSVKTDLAFAMRITDIADHNPDVPSIAEGRYVWITRQFQNKFGEKISREAVRKWFSGELRPRKDKMEMLAAVLKADLAYLSLGHTSTPLEATAASNDALTNITLGMFQLAGATCSLLTDRDAASFYATIKGKRYAIAVGRFDDDGVTLPKDSQEAISVAANVTPSMEVEMFAVPKGVISDQGIFRRSRIVIPVTRKKGALVAKDTVLRRIKNITTEVPKIK